jgi:hypothetical protein
MRFIKFLVIWIASNLSIPFWMVGHVHLTTNVYQDLTEIVASMGMNIVVAVGFWLDWKASKKVDPFPIGTEITFVQYGSEETTIATEKGVRVVPAEGVKIKAK